MSNTGRLSKTLLPEPRRILFGEAVSESHVGELRLLAEIDLAYSAMLATRGLIAPASAAAIQREIGSLLEQDFRPLMGRPTPRGLYLAYEGFLIEGLTAEVAGSIHLGRSRNDINATVFRLRMRPLLARLELSTLKLAARMLSLAERHEQSIIPHHTHFQSAFPITLGHYLAAVCGSLLESCNWLESGIDQLLVCPLGAGAGAGSSVPTDPSQVAELLGFERAAGNSLRAVADRDLALRISGAAAVMSIPLSRMCSDLMLWLSSEYALVRLPDELVGSSSMMPQKRNPFVLEHIRARLKLASQAFSCGTAMMADAPYSNSIEVGGEAVPRMMENLDGYISALRLLGSLVPAIEVDRDRALDASVSGFVTAVVETERRAVETGEPFRTVHASVGAEITRYEQDMDGRAAGLGGDRLSPQSAVEALRYGGGPGDVQERRRDVQRMRGEVRALVELSCARRRRWRRAKSVLFSRRTDATPASESEQ